MITPSFGKNRDNKEVQVGHKFDIHFKLPIVKDSIKPKDKSNKRKGYDLVDRVKSVGGGNLLLDKGGRPKKK